MRYGGFSKEMAPKPSRDGFACDSCGAEVTPAHANAKVSGATCSDCVVQGTPRSRRERRGR